MQWMIAHPWMTFFLAALAIYAVDNVVVNICKTIVFLAEPREAAEGPEESVWHDAKTDPPKTPGVYYGKRAGSSSIRTVTYQDGVWGLENNPLTQLGDIVQWAEKTDFKEAGDGS